MWNVDTISWSFFSLFGIRTNQDARSFKNKIQMKTKRSLSAVKWSKRNLQRSSQESQGDLWIIAEKWLKVEATEKCQKWIQEWAMVIQSYLIPLVSGSELETRVKFSRSQKRTRRSAAPEASRNSCGWNTTSLTGAVCSRSSDSNLPARMSQTCTQHQQYSNFIQIYTVVIWMMITKRHNNICYGRLFVYLSHLISRFFEIRLGIPLAFIRVLWP